MSEIRTIPEKISASGIQNASIDAVGKFSKKVIHHNAGPPTAADDTGLGYAAGSIWVDSTNGDMYTAKTVTAEDANWINMEGDDVNPPFTIQAGDYGWTMGHLFDPGSPGHPGNINRYAQTSSGNGSDVGELASAVRDATVGSIRDDTYGFCSGGIHPPGISQAYIQRFTFTAPTTVTDIGEMTRGWTYACGATDGNSGFVCAGMEGPPNSAVTTIDKFSLAAPPVTATDSGMEIITECERGCGLTDSANAHGYQIGGVDLDASASWGPGLDTVQKFSFTGSGTATDVTECVQGELRPTGTASITHGYLAGGAPRGSYVDVNIVEKFAFSAPQSVSDVGDLTQVRSGIMGASGTTHAYHAGGADWGPSSCFNIIDRSSNSADGNSTDVGDLSEIGASGGGFEN